LKNRYKVLGLALTVAGIIAAPVFYFFTLSVQLTAVALSSAILGLASFFLADTASKAKDKEQPDSESTEDFTLKPAGKFILFLAVAFGLANALLTFAKQEDIAIYFIANAAIYLIAALFYIHINPKAKPALNNLSVVIFSAFLTIVAWEVIDLFR